MGGGAPRQRLRVVPSLPPEERRAEAPLHRVLRVVGQPVHAAPGRLRARDADDRGARGVRGAPAGADRDRRVGTRGRRLVPPRGIPSGRAARVRGARRRDARLRAAARGGSTRRRTRSAPPSRTGTSASRRGTSPTTSSRSGRRSTRRATGCTHTGSPTRSSGRRSTAHRRSASTSRRAGRGRTSSAGAGRSGSTGTSRSRRRSRRWAPSTSTTSSVRSTAPSRG